jgi:uncharacterized protein YukE
VPGAAQWAAVTASQSAQQAWTSFLTALAATITGLATDLDAAAKGYVGTDQAAAGRVGASRNRAI